MRYREFVKLAKMTAAEKDLAKGMYGSTMLAGGIAGGIGGGLIGGIGGLFVKKNKLRSMLKWMLLGGLGGGALGMGGGAALGHRAYKAMSRLADEMDEQTRDRHNAAYATQQEMNNRTKSKPLVELTPYVDWRERKVFPYSDLAAYLNEKGKRQAKERGKQPGASGQETK